MRIFWIFVVLVICCLSRSALCRYDPPAVKEEHLIRLHQDETPDRGAVAIGSPVVRRVGIENIWSGKLRLKVVDTSCPCTQGHFQKNDLDPSETTTLIIATTSVDAPGEQSYTVTIEAATGVEADARKEQALLAISYHPDVVAIVRPRMIRVSTIAGEPGVGEVFVRRLDRKPLTFKGITANLPWVSSADPSSPEQISGMISVPIRTEPQSVGVRHARLSVAVEGEASTKEQIELTARVESPFVAIPSGCVWRESPDGWGTTSISIAMAPRIAKCASLVPAKVEVDPPCNALIFSDIAQLSNELGKWGVSIRLDPARLLDTEGHGMRTVRILGKDGEILCEIPAIWFRASSVKAPPAGAGAKGR